MNEVESLILQGLKISVDSLALEIARHRQEAASRGRYADLPEWIDLEQAVVLKRGVCAEKKRAESGKARSAEAPVTGGASLVTYRQRSFLQPCCGKNYRMVGGRRCWKKDDVILWLEVTDEDLLKYAESHRAPLPKVYEERGLKNAR